MHLILAIEPDHRQASKLAMLAHNYLHTELVVTDSIGRALAILDERLPDLILTSHLLPLKHRAALTDRLREIDPDGTKVQTLLTPALGMPGCRGPHQQKGLPARPHEKRGSHIAADGCDPIVFGRQIAAYLGRAAAEGRSAPAVEWAPAVPLMIPEPEPSQAESERAPTPSSRLARPEWRDLLSTIRRDLDQMRADHAEPSAETTARVTIPTPAAPKVESPRRIRRRTAPAPPQDEWGFFDPQKCGFAALFTKVNEITKAEKAPAKKPA